MDFSESSVKTLFHANILVSKTPVGIIPDGSTIIHQKNYDYVLRNKLHIMW